MQVHGSKLVPCTIVTLEKVAKASNLQAAPLPPSGTRILPKPPASSESSGTSAVKSGVHTDKVVIESEIKKRRAEVNGVCCNYEL